MPYQVIYSSQASAPFSDAALEALLADAREGNRRRGITGALVYVDGVFLQVLEGEKDTVQRLMASIAKDTRHGGVHVFHEGESAQPMFAAWTMARVTSSPADLAAWLGHDGATSVPALLHELHRSPGGAAGVVDGILRALAS